MANGGPEIPPTPAQQAQINRLVRSNMDPDVAKRMVVGEPIRQPQPNQGRQSPNIPGGPEINQQPGYGVNQPLSANVPRPPYPQGLGSPNNGPQYQPGPNINMPPQRNGPPLPYGTISADGRSVYTPNGWQANPNYRQFPPAPQQPRPASQYVQPPHQPSLNRQPMPQIQPVPTYVGPRPPVAPSPLSAPPPPNYQPNQIYRNKKRQLPHPNVGKLVRHVAQEARKKTRNAAKATVEAGKKGVKTAGKEIGQKAREIADTAASSVQDRKYEKANIKLRQNDIKELEIANQPFVRLDDARFALREYQFLLELSTGQSIPNDYPPLKQREKYLHALFTQILPGYFDYQFPEDIPTQRRSYEFTVIDTIPNPSGGALQQRKRQLMQTTSVRGEFDALISTVLEEYDPKYFHANLRKPPEALQKQYERFLAVLRQENRPLFSTAREYALNTYGLNFFILHNIFNRPHYFDITSGKLLYHQYPTVSSAEALAYPTTAHKEKNTRLNSRDIQVLSSEYQNGSSKLSIHGEGLGGLEQVPSSIIQGVRVWEMPNSGTYESRFEELNRILMGTDPLPVRNLKKENLETLPLNNDIVLLQAPYSDNHTEGQLPIVGLVSPRLNSQTCISLLQQHFPNVLWKPLGVNNDDIGHELATMYANTDDLAPAQVLEGDATSKDQRAVALLRPNSGTMAIFSGGRYAAGLFTQIHRDMPDSSKAVDSYTAVRNRFRLAARRAEKEWDQYRKNVERLERDEKKVKSKAGTPQWVYHRIGKGDQISGLVADVIQREGNMYVYIQGHNSPYQAFVKRAGTGIVEQLTLQPAVAARHEINPFQQDILASLAQLTYTSQQEVDTALLKEIAESLKNQISVWERHKRTFTGKAAARKEQSIAKAKHVLTKVDEVLQNQSTVTTPIEIGSMKPLKSLVADEQVRSDMLKALKHSDRGHIQDLQQIVGERMKPEIEQRKPKAVESLVQVSPGDEIYMVHSSVSAKEVADIARRSSTPEDFVTEIQRNSPYAVAAARIPGGSVVNRTAGPQAGSPMPPNNPSTPPLSSTPPAQARQPQPPGPPTPPTAPSSPAVQQVAVSRTAMPIPVPPPTGDTTGSQVSPPDNQPAAVIQATAASPEPPPGDSPGDPDNEGDNTGENEPVPIDKPFDLQDERLMHLLGVKTLRSPNPPYSSEAEDLATQLKVHGMNLNPDMEDEKVTNILSLLLKAGHDYRATNRFLEMDKGEARDVIRKLQGSLPLRDIPECFLSHGSKVEQIRNFLLSPKSPPVRETREFSIDKEDDDFRQALYLQLIILAEHWQQEYIRRTKSAEWLL